MRVLLIDDNLLDVRKIHELMIQSEPACDVRSVQSATEGLRLLRKTAADAVLLNPSVAHPPATGLLAAVRSAVPDAPIIVLSDGYDPAALRAYAQIGIDGAVDKKRVSASRLWRIIRFSRQRAKSLKGLRQRKIRFQTAIEQLPDPYYEMDFNGVLTYVNQQMCKTYNESMETLVGLDTGEFVAPDDAARMRQIYVAVFQSGASKKITNWGAVHRDGTVYSIETSISLIRNLDDVPIGFSGISRNVTDNVAAQKALQRSEEKYRTILDNIEDGYFEVDLKGRLIFFNQSVMEFYGYTDEEMAIIDNRSYMDTKTSRRIYRAYRHIYETGEPNRSLQYEIITKQGVRKYCESSVALMTDNKGQPIGFRGLVRDIAARKAVELALKRAKARADAATQAKSEFLANMSHEIRTPMNGIIGMFRLLLNTSLSSEQTEYVKTGKRSATGLLTLINDVLDYSKIDAGKLDLEAIDFNLRSMVEDLVMLPAARAQAKGVEFIYRIDHQAPRLLKGDPGRLRQIIVNLLSNALKFTQCGEIALFVILENEDEETVRLRFAVKDTGIGISKKDQARLFRSFQQVDGSVTRKYGGAGLGLVISRRLTELMGGHMGVNSAEGEGAMFWFVLDFLKSGNTGHVKTAVPAALQEKRILIVDDNKTNLDVLEGYLKIWGCRCDRATSGAMALSLMKAMARARAPYDLVINDMVMPRMDGANLGQCIKGDPDLTRTRLIMLTSIGMRGDAAEMKRIGYSAYLTKPVRPSQLLDCLIAVLARETGPVDAGKPQPLVTSHSLAESGREKVHILLVEDNAINRKLALHLLGHFGFTVDTAENGQAALQALRDGGYDVVLMDVQMPVMDGLEATRAIRASHCAELDADVPIIAMTARGDPEDRTACLDAGMDDYVAKPLEPETLHRAIMQILGSERRRRGGDSACPR